MLRTVTRVTAIAAMLAAGSLGSLALASGVAGASAPTVTCTTGTINITGSGTLKGCNDTANTGGKGTIKATISPAKGTITWAPGFGTTTFTYKYVIVTPDTKCSPKTDKEIKETATTTGGTGKAVKSIKKGQVATTYICEAGSKVTLAPGSKYQI
jgi:hypothetical protein